MFSILQSSGLSYFYELKRDGVCFVPQPSVLMPSKLSFTDWDKVKSREVDLYIEGVHCSACLWLLEKLPLLLPESLTSCRLDLRRSILSVSLKPEDNEFGHARLSLVAEQIVKWGYTPHLIEDQKQSAHLREVETRKRLIEVGIAGAVAGNVMLMSIPLYSGIEGPFRTLFEWISFGLSIPALFYSGQSFFKNVKNGIKARTFPIDGPILLALLIAFFYSTYSLILKTHQLYFDSLTALIFLLLASRYYLYRMRQSSELSLGTLDFFKSTFSGKVGDLISITADQEVPFDGVIREGDVWVDNSKFSGESQPVHLKPGDLIYAGTRVLSTSVLNTIEVLLVGQATRLSHLLKKVEESQTKRSNVEMTSDRFAQKLLMIVLSVGIVSLVIFLKQGMGAEALTRFLALLIVTCPCALALATPLVFTLAMKTLLKKGILVKDPNSLDQANHISKIFFDKTGTLTEGHLSVSSPLLELPQKIQSILYSMTLHSTHPVSRAIYSTLLTQTNTPTLMEWQKFEEKIGVGLFCTNSEASFRLVRAPHPQSSETEVCLFQDLHNASYELARVMLSDQLRDDSKVVITRLNKDGYDTAILSGDHLEAANRIAKSAGITETHALLSPEQKSTYVSQGIMIGDGLNDALALSSAKVSIAVQGGMEAAIQSSQVYSLRPGISGVLPFLKVSKVVASTLKINFAMSSSYNLIGAILSLSGYMNPLLAAILMPMSALSVFTYSIWRFKKL